MLTVLLWILKIVVLLGFIFVLNMALTYAKYIDDLDQEDLVYGSAAALIVEVLFTIVILF